MEWKNTSYSSIDGLSLGKGVTNVVIDVKVWIC